MKNKNIALRFYNVLLPAVCSFALFFSAQAFDYRFDVCTFCCPCWATNHMCQAQFDALNSPTNASQPNGKLLMMGNDSHRDELHANGNFLGAYYNTLNDNYCCMTGAQKADDIENNYIIPLFTTTGTKTTWIALNELSVSLWPNDANYRAWVIALCSRLHSTYGHSLLVYSPFPNPGAHGSDWASLASYAYIVSETYLTGAAVNASGNSVSWCQSQYQSSFNSYTALGVPASKLMIVEHFAETVSGVNWGRSGCSTAGWDNAIRARNTAIHNVGFAGFSSYGWNGNGMNCTDTELIQHINTYTATKVP